MSAELYRDLEDRKGVRPGREAAGTPVAVEFARHGEHRVAGSLAAEVVELGAADLRVEMAAAVRLGVGGSKQEFVEPFERPSALDSLRSETVDPPARFDVELFRKCSRAALRSLRSHLHEETTHALSASLAG